MHADLRKKCFADVQLLPAVTIVIPTARSSRSRASLLCPETGCVTATAFHFYLALDLENDPGRIFTGSSSGISGIRMMTAVAWIQ